MSEEEEKKEERGSRDGDMAAWAQRRLGNSDVGKANKANKESEVSK
jgi:hypothetical protein